jgi:hypothetical protein
MRVALLVVPQALAWVSVPIATRPKLIAAARRSGFPKRWHTHLCQSNNSLVEDPEILFSVGSGLPREDINTPLLLLNEDVVHGQKYVLDEILALKNGVVMGGSNSTTTMAPIGIPVKERQRQLESRLVTSPKGLTMQEFQNATALFLQTPFAVRYAFCEALELEEPGLAASDLGRMQEIVALLYQQRVQLTPQRLQKALEKVQNRLYAKSNTLDEAIRTESTISNATLHQQILNYLPKSREQLQKESNVKDILPRVTRNQRAAQHDLDILLKVLNGDTFVVASTESIPGGFLIRGRKSSQISPLELLSALDEQLPAEYLAQVSLIDDVTTVDILGEVHPDPVLILLNKDFSPRVPDFVAALSSAVAVLSSYVYCFSVYGSNDILQAKLFDAMVVNDAETIAWFNSKVLDVLVPLLALQGLHDIGHYAIAKLRNVKMEFPTLLPFWGIPLMGSKTELLSSPTNRNVLADFAMSGPLVGMLASLGCLITGLELTVTADAGVSQYFPSLPVSLLSASTLGGTMVDYFLEGGLFISLQDPSTMVPLHPLAIAGYISLLINALSLLPLGSTDGGRLSLAIFGRYGHVVVGSLVWISILIASCSLQRVEILFCAWLVNNVIQREMEVPCRDETEPVSPWRVLTALTLWSVTALLVIPLS